MERIASFQVDHRKIDVGMYISRVDGDIVTYDIRMVKPNGGVYLETPSMHTIEHLFATFARNSEFGKGIVYVGPMGCRTGFYLLTRGMSHEAAISWFVTLISLYRSLTTEFLAARRKNAETIKSIIFKRLERTYFLC